VGLLLSIVLLAILLMVATYDPDHLSLLLVGMLVPLPPILGEAILIRTGRRRDSFGVMFIAVGLLIIAASVLCGLVFIVAGFRGPIDFLPDIAAYIMGPLAILGFGWLQAPTVAGRGILDRIEGFRRYLGVAEEDRLNALTPPEETPELFERFLPYAIALDVENRWAKRFGGVLAATGTSAAVGSWYADSRDWRADPVGFADHLGGALSHTIASASSPPGSSDSGGSSGGGGGGGGGSGW